MRARILAVAALALAAGCPKHVTQEVPTVSLEALSDGQQISGFTARAVYLDDAGKPLGARFTHDHTGFVLDYVQIPSVDQGFVWVNTVPDSDRGEPHTQEHLLLGKGNKGRSVASLSAMSLVESSAYTEQTRTIYHFHTLGSPEVFFDAFEFQLDGLLHPDYTDEEIRREVHHYGVADAPDGSLRLEEKGTIYNEMAGSYDRPAYRLWTAMEAALWGPGHGYSLSSGGWPDDIREMKPEHIRTFHAANYQLGNMGMIGSFGPDRPMATVLSELDARLVALQPEPTPKGADYLTEADLPPGVSAAEGAISIVAYPSADTARPGDVVVAWPPTRDLSLDDTVLLRAFLQAWAGSEASPLYKRLVDSTTRTIDVGGTGVWAYAMDRAGTPVLAGLDGVPAEALTDETAARVRAEIRAMLAEIAAWPAGSAELEAFEALVRSGVAVNRREYRQLVSSPPRWGYRGTYSTWNDHILLLDRAGGFRRSMTLTEAFGHVDSVLDRADNPWGALLAGWGLLDAEPYAFVTRADPALLAAQEKERFERLAAETARLRESLGAEDDQEALAKFRAAYDADTAALEAVAAAGEMPKFVDGPPMTPDDSLDYEVSVVPGTKIPLFAGHFSTMTGATTTLALDLRGVPRSEWLYLPVLSALTEGTGVVVDGEPIPHDRVVEMLQQEILGLGVGIDVDFDARRHEIQVSATGTTPEESARAVVWMRRIVGHADWRPENLPRIRDVVAERLVGLQAVTQGSEEGWVQGPPTAWRNGDAGQLLMNGNFLTATHAVRRVKWRLVEPPSAAFQALLADVRDAGKDRAGIEAALATLADGSHPRLAGLPAAEKVLAASVAADLAAALGGVPDTSLAKDWASLCAEASADLAMDPATVLASLRGLRERILAASRARVVVASAPSTVAVLDLPGLVADLDPDAPEPTFEPAPDLFAARLKERGIDARPLYVGLAMPDLRGGVFVLSVPGPSVDDTDRESLLRALAGNTYTGHGAHSLFMKTWSAGLAYSNGVRPDLTHGRLLYYAERCPELPQTLGFVIEQLKGAKVDDGIAQYAIAEAFRSRAGDGFEARAAAMAEDLFVGRSPDKVRAFRTALLALRDEPGLAGELEGRLESVYGEVLPGWGPPSAAVEGANYFVLGNDRQLSAWDAWLAANEPGARLVVVYPRDYWLPDAP